MSKAFWIIGIITFLGMLPFACDFGSEKTLHTSFKIDSLSLITGKIESNESHFYITPLDFSAQTDTLSHAKLGFEIKIANATYSHHPNLISPWVFNSAFADPVPPSSEATIALVSIYSNHAITTSTDDFDAGDNLVNIFECYRGYKWTTIHEMLQGDEDWYDYETIILRFNQHPTHELNQNFFIKITMSDGGVFELESNTVITQ